jgi:hypothetical protein
VVKLIFLILEIVYNVDSRIYIRMEEKSKKRFSKRLPFYNTIEILRSSEENITANTLNISQDGICILSNQNIPVGTNILAHLFIGSEICEIEGKIDWSSKNPSDNSIKMGVRLLKVTNEFNEIYQRINRKFNNPKTATKSETYSIQIIHKV